MSVINTDDGKAVGPSNPLPTQLMGSNVTDAKALGTGDVGGANMLYNGATWDRQRGNSEGTLLASAARTASLDSPLQTNHNAKGVLVTLKVTAASGTGGVQLVIVGRTASGVTVQLNASPTTVIAIGTYVYELFPGIGVAGGQVTQRTSGTLPRQWYVRVNHGDATSYTYSVDYDLSV